MDGRYPTTWRLILDYLMLTALVLYPPPFSTQPKRGDGMMLMMMMMMTMVFVYDIFFWSHLRFLEVTRYSDENGDCNTAFDILYGKLNAPAMYLCSVCVLCTAAALASLTAWRCY